MALPQEQEAAQNYIPPTEGSLAVDPNRITANPARILPFRTIDGAVPPTAKEARAANAGELAPRGAQRWLLDITRGWAARFLGGSVVAAAGYTAYENAPAIRQIVEDFRTDATGTAMRIILEKWPAIQGKIDEVSGKGIPTPNSFDAGMKSERIKAGTNAIPISEDKLPTLFEKASKASGLEIFFPVKLSPQGIVDYGADNNRSFRIVDGKPRDVELTIPKKGEEIIVPVEQAEAFLGNPWVVNGKPYFSEVFLKWPGEDKSVYIMILSWGSPDVRAINLTDNIKGAPIHKTNDRNAWQNIINSEGLSVTGGLSILTTEFDFAKVRMNIGKFGQNGLERQKIVPFKFITETAEDGSQKLLYLPQNN